VLLLSLDEGDCFIRDVIFEDLLNILIKFASIVLVVTLVHDNLVHLHVLLRPGNEVVVASQKAEDSVDIVFLDQGTGLLII